MKKVLSSVCFLLIQSVCFQNSAFACDSSSIAWKSPGTPIILDKSATLLTKSGKYKCNIDDYYILEPGFILSCTNGSKVELGKSEYCRGDKFPNCEYETVKDSKGSEYKMRSSISETFECRESTVLWKMNYLVYQESFRFNTIVQFVVKRKLTPKPSGF
jgi:hypothetical protein